MSALRGRISTFSASLMRAGLLTVLAGACSDHPLEVKWFELPPPSTSLDPDSLNLGELRFSCGFWKGGPPPSTQTVILDAHFYTGEAETGEPSADQLQAIARAGGEVGYKFNFPAVRIRIPSLNVPTLYEETEAVFYSVPDLGRYDWSVAVVYSRDITPQDDSVFAALGGRVTHRLTYIKQLIGILPDRSIPALLQQEGVYHVGKTRVFCNTA